MTLSPSRSITGEASEGSITVTGILRETAANVVVKAGNYRRGRQRIPPSPPSSCLGSISTSPARKGGSRRVTRHAKMSQPAPNKGPVSPRQITRTDKGFEAKVQVHHPR